MIQKSRDETYSKEWRTHHMKDEKKEKRKKKPYQINGKKRMTYTAVLSRTKKVDRKSYFRAK